ncbi:MAG TPA: 2-dehydropantoate 2-reductase [Acetobacteraceae bacterium]
MRILMVGAGAIGGYFGGRAAEAGADVTFLVRPRRAAQLAVDGLVIRSPRGDMTRPVATVQAGALGGPYDAVVLSCKAYDLDDAIASFAPAAGPGAAILPLLNGMRHLDVLDARFGPGAVLGGQCQIAATLEPDGMIRHLGDLQALSLGERDGSMSPRVEALAAAFAGCGGRASGTILQDMWEKWVFLASLACLTSSMRAAVGDVAAAGGTWFAQGLFDEAAAIAATAGHPPRQAFVERMRGAIAAPGSTFTASMLRDIERGGRIEAEHIVGDLIARGPEEGTRLLRTAYLHLKAYEARRAREAG